jgi:hypothetical protein
MGNAVNVLLIIEKIMKLLAVCFPKMEKKPLTVQ